MTSSLSHIKSLKPDTFRIHSIFKVIELAICLQVTKPNPVTIYEYLVADDSGCIILNTTSELTIGFTYEIKDGHTGVIENYIRVYSNQPEPCFFSLSNPNTQNNLSLVHLERKI
ncbi:hypothetical protein HPULCUR_006048 [Helicostylum pulchrum]|uniref:Uncharacterized protein n=1 Tax=Helicostylum pulchrum TaxID=562976 RepID=A0ABP9Y0T6_9FUNG